MPRPGGVGVLRVGRVLLGPGAVPERRLVAHVRVHAAVLARAGHEDQARAFAGADEDVRRPRR